MIKNSNEAAPWSLAILFFLGMGLILLTLSWPSIVATSYEVGDFAANSVQIQKAKIFQLFHGNYSRVGFYHPGPAILYTLALGEILFHDFMNLTTPVGGQLIAVILYNSAWATLVFMILAQLFKGSLNALIGIAAFYGATALFAPEAFTGLWFPHLYYFPFACFTVALALTIAGETRFLLILAVSAGFLVNGHVSFAAIVGVMLIVGLGANFTLARSGILPQHLNWWSAAFWRAHRRQVGLAIVLGSLFLLPLAIDTIVNFPGQVPKYLAFGGNTTGNSAAASLEFLLSYVGSAPIVAIAILGLLSLATATKNTRDGAPLALAAALAAGSLATFFYARTGIDDLNQRYIAYYYSAVPALAITLATVCLSTLLNKLPRQAFLFLLFGLIFWESMNTLRKPVPYAATHFNSLYLEDLYRKVSALGPNLVLDLDNTRDWDWVWQHVTGMQALASRRGEKLFCIARNWHIVFTEEYRCSKKDLAEAQTVLVTTSSPPLLGMNPLIKMANLSFYQVTPPLLSTGTPFVVAADKTLSGNFLLESGWSPVEEEFVWSQAREAVLKFRAPKETQRLKLDMGAFTPGNHVQRIAVEIDGILASELVFDANSGRRWESFELPKGTGAAHIVKLRIQNPLSPKKAGLSNDPRHLGVALYALVVE